MLNTLFEKNEFVSCSVSGKKGKKAEEAKPPLDKNRVQAILGKDTLLLNFYK